MSLAAIVEALFEAGATREMIVAAVRAHEAINAPSGPSKSSAALRQERYRQRSKASQTVTSVTATVTPVTHPENVTTVTKSVTEASQTVTPRGRVREIKPISEIPDSDSSLRSEAYIPARETVTVTMAKIDERAAAPKAPKATKKAARDARASWIEWDWTPDEIDATHAAGKGYSPEQVKAIGNKFFLHHKAKGSTFVDWRAAWRKWLLNDVEWNGGPQGGNGSSASNRVPADDRRKAQHQDRIGDMLAGAMDALDGLRR